MANPTLSKKTAKKMSLTDNAKRLFQVVYRDQKKEESKKDDDVAMIKVSELISKMSFYYEKIRNTVDDNEDHLLRKCAIERILKRQIVIEGAIPTKSIDANAVSRHLLTELIRASYLENSKVPEKKIKEVEEIIKKYLYLRKCIIANLKESDEDIEKSEITNWIIAILACDIEEELVNNTINRYVVDYMYDVLEPVIKLDAKSNYEKDREIQIFVGIYRNYLKYDLDMLNFVLFKYYNEDWKKAKEIDVERIAKDFVHLRATINHQIHHPLLPSMNRLISRYTVFFTILVDVITDDPEGTYGTLKKDSNAFSRLVKNVCDKRYKLAKSKLARAAFRSIIYIFITKSVFAALIEIPATKFLGEEIDWIALAINVSFPAVLLFFIVMFTRLPAEKNTVKIIEGIEEVLFKENKREKPYKLKPSVKRSGFSNTVFGLIYAVTFFLSFGAVIWVLDKINFNWVSMIIFLFFLTFVSFFSVRIRKNAKELIIIEEKENIFSFIAEFFYVPIVSAGKWLSERFSKINVFIFVLDFIIEAPFKVFVEITEDWSKYVKERRDEIV